MTEKGIKRVRRLVDIATPIAAAIVSIPENDWKNERIASFAIELALAIEEEAVYQLDVENDNQTSP